MNKKELHEKIEGGNKAYKIIMGLTDEQKMEVLITMGWTFMLENPKQAILIMEKIECGS